MGKWKARLAKACIVLLEWIEYKLSLPRLCRDLQTEKTTKQIQFEATNKNKRGHLYQAHIMQIMQNHRDRNKEPFNMSLSPLCLQHVMEF